MPMRSTALLLLIAALVGCRQQGWPAAPAAGPAPISVDWRDTRQTIVGFGGTMGWVHPHPEQREKVFDLLFNDLGVSVLRIQALGGEGGDEESLEPANDNADPADINWAGFPIRTTEAKNATIIKAARDRGVKTIIPVAWSPPGWMKDTGRRAGGGSLQPQLLAEYAELWAAYVIGMKREFDIDIRDISIQNEPDLSYTYPTCRWEPELYAKAVGEVAARLRREKLNVRVLGPDTCRIYHVPEYVEALDAAKATPRTPILTHLYDLSIPYERVDRDPERWRTARDLARKCGRPLWLMETANYLSYGIEPASFDEAMIWAQKMHWALTEGDCEVVCWWALFFDKRCESLVYCAKSEDPSYEVTPKFYTSMNYYRYVRPGMVRSAARSADPGLLVSAFGDRKSRVVVVINTLGEPRTVDLSRALAGRLKRYETTSTRKCELNGQAGGEIVLPERSVTTFVQELQQE